MSTEPTLPTLFIDFDNCKFSTKLAEMAYINWRYGVNSVPADYADSFWIDEILAKYLPPEKIPSREEIYRDLTLNYLTSIEHHASIEPMEGICEVLPLLAKRYSLWTVTARVKTSQTVVMHMNELHVPGCISGVHHVWDFVEGKFKKIASKRDFIASFAGKKVGFIDDSPTEVLEVDGVVPAFLFDPHHQHDGNTRIQRRVRNWHEIGEIFLAA
ncbi:MAG TPA: hypothetical protein VGE35_03700 [Candidatus Paceibacterota bacterium]